MDADACLWVQVTANAEFPDIQQVGDIRVGPSLTAGGGLGIVGIEGSFGVGVNSNATNRGYVQGESDGRQHL